MTEHVPHVSPQPVVPGWSHDDGVRFEVARNLLAQLVGHAANRVGAATGLDSSWRVRQQQWVARRSALTPGDADVERVLADEGPLLRGLLSGGDLP